MFRPDIERATANLLVHHAETLTYRQLLLMAVLFKRELFNIGPAPRASDGMLEFVTVTYLMELYDLFRRGLVAAPNHGATEFAILNIVNLNPAALIIRGPGAVLYQLLELQRIPESELVVVVSALTSDR